MDLRHKLQLTLSHKLILTPSLQQAIKPLPMTTLELVDMLNQEVVENPLLEDVPAEEQSQTDAAAQVEQADPDPPPTTERQDTWDDKDYEYHPRPGSRIPGTGRASLRALRTNPTPDFYTSGEVVSRART